MTYQLKIWEETDTSISEAVLERHSTLDKAIVSLRSWVSLGYRVTIRELEPSIYDL